MTDIIRAHNHCINNREEISRSKRCGCFYCEKIFEPSEIINWVNKNNNTALCPYCMIDSVLGDASVEITESLLKGMFQYYFNTDVQLFPRCSECGGAVDLRQGHGRTREYKKGLFLDIPDSFMIPTCNDCGYFFMIPDVTGFVDEYLENIYKENYHD